MDGTMSDRRREQVRSWATRLKELESPIRILRAVSWPADVKERFFAGGERELPRVSYQPRDMSATFAGLAELRKELGPHPVERWLDRQAAALEAGAGMMAGVGSGEFSRWSVKVYGAPKDSSVDGRNSVLDLAHHLEDTLHELEGIDIGAPPAACHLAQSVAKEIEDAMRERFGDEAPRVELVDDLASNAIAGSQRIRLRRTACFTDLDAQQLLHHEAFIHVATSLNGRRQEGLPILGAGHPGTTRTQEGLAVFAEMISGTWDLDRLHRLARRVIGIQMALDGADFLQVYRYFRGEGIDREQAFENTRRIFRGGLVEGGAPFTKDAVYLDGLLRVHSFLRTLVAEGRTDILRLLFCGKLDLEDVPVLAHLYRAGLLKPPRFLPPWAEDLRYLLSYLGLSLFLNQVDLAAVRRRFQGDLAETVQLDL